MKTWKKQIENWMNGIPLKVPSCPTEDYSKGFYYQTTCCDQEMKNPYRHVFKKASGLPEKQDISKVKEYLKNPKTKYATYFPSRNPGTIVVIPVPRRGKNFAHLRLFEKNASKKQQQEYWKFIARLVQELLKENSSLFISTHGHHIPLFHVRIECKPKNQFPKRFLNSEKCKSLKEKCSF